MTTRIIPALVTVGLMLGTAVSTAADPITLDGVTFGDVRGGVTLIDGWGSGTLGDPFVLVEEITENGPAILTIFDLSAEFGNRIDSHHTVGFALTKIVRNRTVRTWRSFTLELQEFIGYTSSYEDGLSFGQATNSGRPFLSDGYVEIRESNEPADRVAFSGGTIGPGETVAFTVVVTDMSPKPLFYLVQNRGSFVAEAPATPATPATPAAPARGDSPVQVVDARVDFLVSGGVCGGPEVGYSCYPGN